MNVDPRAALSDFVSALETHLELSAIRRGEDDPAVLAAYERLADAFVAYDDALLSAYGEVTPLDLPDEDDEEEDDEDDQSLLLDDEEYEAVDRDDDPDLEEALEDESFDDDDEPFDDEEWDDEEDEENEGDDNESERKPVVEPRSGR